MAVANPAPPAPVELALGFVVAVELHGFDFPAVFGRVLLAGDDGLLEARFAVLFDQPLGAEKEMLQPSDPHRSLVVLHFV